MIHWHAWSQIGGDILVFLCYSGPLFMMISVDDIGALSKTSCFFLGLFLTAMSHLISAGLIK